MNDLILLGTRHLDTTTWIKPDYELCVRLNLIWAGIHYHSSKYEMTDLGRLDIPYVNECPIFPAYKHPITMTQWEGINVFKSAAYDENGVYMSVHGYEGKDWRMVICGDDTDVRRRKLVGNGDAFNAWVSKLGDRLPTVEKHFESLKPDDHRLRVITYMTANELAECLQRAVGKWAIYNSPGISTIRWVELQREEDIALIPQIYSICGTNWQQGEPIYTSEATETTKRIGPAIGARI